MPNLNKVLLIGHLGRDAEVRYTHNGTAVINFSLATTEKWTNASGQKQERTEWHNVIYFAKSENVAQYLTKGKAVYVEGSIQTDEYEKDGQKRRATKIKAERVQLMGGGERDGAERPITTKPTASRHSDPVDADDIPF